VLNLGRRGHGGKRSRRDGSLQGFDPSKGS
jgi:hypothetical protein